MSDVQTQTANSNAVPPAGASAASPVSTGTVPAGSTQAATIQAASDMVELVVSGEKRMVTMDELKRMASESAGAQRKFQEAADLRRQAESGLRIQELTNRIRATETPDEADVFELMRLMGVQPEQVPSAPAGKTAAQTPPAGPIRREQLDDRTQQVLAAAEEMELQTIRTQIESETRKGIDLDPVISTMLNNVPEERRNALKDELFDMALENVRGQIFNGTPFSPTMVQTVAQRMRSRLKSLGIGEAPRAPQVPGTGPGPGYSGSQGIALDKPINRIPANQPGYINNVVDRTLQMMQRAAAGLKMKP